MKLVTFIVFFYNNYISYKKQNILLLYSGLIYSPPYLFHCDDLHIILVPLNKIYSNSANYFRYMILGGFTRPMIRASHQDRHHRQLLLPPPLPN